MEKKFNFSMKKTQLVLNGVELVLISLLNPLDYSYPKKLPNVTLPEVLKK